MKEQLHDIHASVVHSLQQRLKTEDQLDTDFGLSKNTLRKFIKDGPLGSYGVRTMKQLLAGANQPVEEIKEEAYKWIRRRISSSDQEQAQLVNSISGNYVIYKRYSTGKQILVTHLTTHKIRNSVYFIDRSYLRSPFSEDASYTEFQHNGFVFFRKDIIYLISFESSNLRMISIDARGLTRYGSSAGIILGTNSDMKPYATRVLIKRVSKLDAEKARGQFNIDDSSLSSIRKYIENEIDEDGTLKALSSLI